MKKKQLKVKEHGADLLAVCRHLNTPTIQLEKGDEQFPRELLLANLTETSTFCLYEKLLVNLLCSVG